MNDTPTPDKPDATERCPRCGMPVKVIRATYLNDDGTTSDAGSSRYYTCAGLTGGGPGSPACDRIAALTAELAEALLAAGDAYNEGRADAEREIVATRTQPIRRRR